MTDARITGIRTIAIPVTDQDRAVAFYAGMLGFETRLDVPFGEGRWIEMAPPGAGTTIALVPAGIPTGIRLTTTDADAAHEALGARGVDTDPQVMHMDGAPPMFALRDPDGNDLILVGGDE